MIYLPFDTILKEKENNNEKVYYVDELSSIEWKTKRDWIEERDNSECKVCFEKKSIYKDWKYYRAYSEEEQKDFENKCNEMYKEYGQILGIDTSRSIKSELQFHQVSEPVILHVHHKYYIQNKYAWEYPDEALISLCQSCHQKTHETTIIKMYNDVTMNNELNLTTCSKCRGSGHIPKYHYYKDGLCFTCKGYKYLELIQK